MGPIWGPPGADRTQVGPVLAPWILLSGLTFAMPFHSTGSWNPSRQPFHQSFFHPISNSMEILFSSYHDSNKVIPTKFCRWHDSCAVMTCAKICCDQTDYNSITARLNSHWIWNASKKSLVKWAPGGRLLFSTTPWSGGSIHVANGDKIISDKVLLSFE